MGGKSCEKTVNNKNKNSSVNFVFKALVFWWSNVNLELNPISCSKKYQIIIILFIGSATNLFNKI